MPERNKEDKRYTPSLKIVGTVGALLLIIIGLFYEYQGKQLLSNQTVTRHGDLRGGNTSMNPLISCGFGLLVLTLLYLPFPWNKDRYNKPSGE